MRLPDQLTCFLRNLDVGQEETVRTRHGTMDWFKIRKGVHQGCILSPCLFNMQNAMLCLVAQLCLTLCYPMDYSSSHPQFSSGQEDSPGKNTGEGCHALLQGIFLTQGLNPGLLHCTWLLYHLSHQGNPVCRIYHVNCWAG